MGGGVCELLEEVGGVKPAARRIVDVVLPNIPFRRN
jgi:hypothetical protein